MALLEQASPTTIISAADIYISPNWFPHLSFCHAASSCSLHSIPHRFSLTLIGSISTLHYIEDLHWCHLFFLCSSNRVKPGKYNEPACRILTDVIRVSVYTYMSVRFPQKESPHCRFHKASSLPYLATWLELTMRFKSTRDEAATTCVSLHLTAAPLLCSVYLFCTLQDVYVMLY